jgi:hypothetical protein
MAPDIDLVYSPNLTINGLHYSAEGYKLLGKRFAEKAAELIKNMPNN